MTRAASFRQAMTAGGFALAGRADGRDNNFNLLRMIAATAVLVSHAYPISLGPGTPEPLSGLLDGRSLGHVAVLVFFAISGFFITRSFDTRRDPTAFLKARGLRLVPGLAVALLVTLVAGYWLTSAPADRYLAAAPDYFLRNLTLVDLRYPLPGVFEDNPYGPAINGSLWTLFHEVACYAGVLALGLAGVLRRPRLALAVLLAVCGIELLSDAGLIELPHRLDRLLTLGTPFALGAALWVWRGRVTLSPAVIVVLALATIMLRQTPLFGLALAATLTAAVFLAGYARLGLTGYNRLGDYSYGLYIYAFPVQQLLAQWGALTPAQNMLAAFPLTLACAVVSWHAVERPAMRLRRLPFRRATAPQTKRNSRP